MLRLGVNDIPYNEGGVTTFQVARWLEDKYGVMAAFYSRHQEDVSKSVENSYGGAMETMFQGGPVVTQPLAGAFSDIKTAFQTFLLTGEIEGMGIPGVPTKAAQDRRSSRFKKGKAPSQRPSFVDTGVFETNFQAWAD